MELRPVTLRSLPAAPGATPGGSAAPADRFEGSAEPSPEGRLRAAARVLTRAGELRKSESKYRVDSWALAPDGSCYVAYEEAWPGKKAYLSRVDAGGRVAWELPLQETKVQHVALEGERVVVGTEHGRVVCSADGELIRREEGPEELRAQFRDATGLRLEILSKDGTPRAFLPDGTAVALPKEAEEINVRSAEPTPEGGLLLVDWSRVVRLAPGGGSAEALALPPWKAEGNKSYSSRRVWSLPGGDLLIEKQTHLEITPRGPHRFMMRGMGGHFDPDHFAPIINTSTSFVRVAPDGTERWNTESLGEELRPESLPDGSVVFPSGGKVRRVDPEGRVTDLFTPPEAATGVRRGAEPGSVLVTHGDAVTRLGGKGGSVVRDGERRGYHLEGDTPDGRILFRDREGALLWSCDPATGRWTRLTDPDVDHSVRVEEIEDAPAEEPGRVEESERWVVIGDVELPRRAGS